MELSITARAPQEGGDSRSIDRFAFEGLSCHVCVCVCGLYCVCLRWWGADTKTRPLKDKGELKPNPASVNHSPRLPTYTNASSHNGGKITPKIKQGDKAEGGVNAD